MVLRNNFGEQAANLDTMLPQFFNAAKFGKVMIGPESGQTFAAAPLNNDIDTAGPIVGKLKF